MVLQIAARQGSFSVLAEEGVLTTAGVCMHGQV